MAINTTNYTDSKAAQAHMAFQALIVITLLSKDSVTGALSIATVFTAIAIPMLLISLCILPGEQKIPRWQVIASGGAFYLGHVAGLIGLSSIFWSFNWLAGLVFLLFSMVGFLIFSGVAAFMYGPDTSISDLLDAVSSDTKTEQVDLDTEEVKV